MKICFLASGNGGNFKFLHLASKLKILDNLEFSLISDRDCDATNYANKHNIYAKVIHYSKSKNEELLDELTYIKPDIIITNWHKIIDKEIVSLYTKKLINLHYSLLPSFSGLIGIAPIQEAYKQHCQFIGPTCHYVDEGVDSGQIISQAIIQTDIPMEHAINTVFQKGCLILLNSIHMISTDRIIDTVKNSQCDFSPSLQYDDSIFDTQFWNRLSQL